MLFFFNSKYVTKKLLVFLVPKQIRFAVSLRRVDISQCAYYMCRHYTCIYTHAYMLDSTYIHTVQLTATSCSHTHT